MKTVTLHALVMGAVMAGCSGSSKPQPISGTVAQSTFGQPVTQVQAVRAGKAAIVAPVAADGSFTLQLPAGKQYRLEFLSAGQTRLVFPRKVGALDWRFDVLGGGKTFDLGMVRNVGDPANMSVTFVQGQTLQSTMTTAAGGNVECEDGKDAKTGAVCIDDDDNDGDNQSCDKDDDDEGDDDDVECEDGKDAKTGAACADDDADDAAATTAPTSAAVADHNIPPAIGSCGNDDGEDNDDDDEKGNKNEK